MRILVIGDFHGKFPKKLKERILKEKVDLIFSVGDHPDTSVFRNLEFKYWKNLDTLSLEEIIGKKKFSDLLRRQSNSQLNILKELKSFNKPLFLIYGNSDLLDKEAKKYSIQGLESHCKNLKLKFLKNNKKVFSDFTILAFSGYRGAMSKKMGKFKKSDLKSIRKFNSKWDKRLNLLFKNFNSSELTIFLAHDSLRGYFDLVKYKKSPLFNKHVGDEYFLKYVKKYEPKFFIAGHMHEYQGIKKFGKTFVISTGAAQDGKAVILDLNENNKKVKINFIK
ncbi:MAG: metallophosphoesterase [Candidatus Pacearchaeota archaeon]|jgi:Icc-related predicted phosphoesterase